MNTNFYFFKSFKMTVKKARQLIETSFNKKYLLYTNTGISLASSALGDVIEQEREIYNKHLTGWDRIRTRNMTISGVFLGVYTHYWYLFLDKYFPGYTMKTVMKKIVIDQFVCSPITISLLFVTVGILEKKNKQQIIDEMKQKAWILYTAEWVIWPTAQFINFYWLPTKYRVLYDSTISLGYDFYTSYIKYSD